MTRVVVAAGVVVAVGAGHLAADMLGAMATASTLAVIGMAFAWLPMVTRHRPAVAEGAAEPDPLAPFVAYRKIEASLNWGRTSQGHYDRIVRPVLARLLAARLAERHGVDLTARPDLAQEIVGADLWPYFDPALIGAGDSSRPGVHDDMLHRLVDRLEEI